MGVKRREKEEKSERQRHRVRPCCYEGEKETREGKERKKERENRREKKNHLPRSHDYFLIGTGASAIPLHCTVGTSCFILRGRAQPKQQRLFGRHNPLQ